MYIIEECKNILNKYENIIFAYIFGSYVKGNVNINSDIDIAIYLENDMDMPSYLDIKLKLSEVCKREIDLIILNDATPLLKYEIYKNHILLFTNNKDMESNFKVKTLFEYNDIKRYLDLSYNKTIARLKKEVGLNG